MSTSEDIPLSNMAAEVANDDAVNPMAPPQISPQFLLAPVMSPTNLQFWRWDELSSQKAFRVRGFEWLQALGGKADARSLTENLDEVREVLSDRPAWSDLFGNLFNRISQKQVLAASNRLPIRLDKAVQVVLLLEIAARRIGVDDTEFFRHIRIEPALFRVDGFDREFLQRATSQRRTFIDDLREAVGQPTAFPIYEVADGHMASFRLAYLLKREASRLFPESYLGQITVEAPFSARLKVARSETVQGPSIPAGASIDPDQPWPNR